MFKLIIKSVLGALLIYFVLTNVLYDLVPNPALAGILVSHGIKSSYLVSHKVLSSILVGTGHSVWYAFASNLLNVVVPILLALGVLIAILKTSEQEY